MDIPREVKPNRRKYFVFAAIGVVLLLATFGLSRLKPAAPTVERGTVLIDTVKRGAMVFQVRGTGTLVPVNVRWIPTSSDCRVEKILVYPGTAVNADTVILELSNPELEQSGADAAWQYKAAQADFVSAKARLETQLLDMKSSLATVKASQTSARLNLEANEQLAQNGLVSHQDLMRSRAQAEELDTRYQIEQDRLKIGTETLQAQLASQQARVEQAKALWQLKQSQVAALRVRAGLSGVLQQVPVQVGQRLAPGTTLAKVAQPAPLKAELKVSETQAKDIQIGQPVSIDTRNGLVEGKVIRIDPAVQNGTVTVDASLDGALPKGTRPDLSVEGIIELDRADDGLFVGRPVQAQAHGTISLFKLQPGSNEAVRVKVRLGRGSVSTIEIVEGLQPGDQVILSDTGAWDAADRIRLN